MQLLNTVENQVCKGLDKRGVAALARQFKKKNPTQLKQHFSLFSPTEGNLNKIQESRMKNLYGKLNNFCIEESNNEK